MKKLAMPEHPVSIFISYSRTNSDFVDRLEADLQARSFHTWVDRGRLEGGVNWLNTIQAAIDRCDVLVVVLSPDAMKSDYVLMEYRHAFRKKKLVIPLDYQSCEVTMDLNDIQWVNFRDNYEQGLMNLLIALNPVGQKVPVPASTPTEIPSPIGPTTTEEPVLVVPQPAPPPPDADLMQLYREGLIAKSEDNLERTAILWQQVLDRNPNFGNRTLATEMEILMKQLHPIRVQRLRERADNAHNAGEWGQEIGTWKALFSLKPDDAQAKERIPVAEQNQTFAWMYQAAVQLVQEGKTPAASAQLNMLWQYAPYYGDPASLASKVGNRNAGNYVQQAAQQAREQTRANRKAEVDRVATTLRQREIIGRICSCIVFTLGGGVLGMRIASIFSGGLFALITDSAIGVIAGFLVIFGLIITGLLSIRLFDKTTYSILFAMKGREIFSTFTDFQNKYISRKLEQAFMKKPMERKVGWLPGTTSSITYFHDIYVNPKYGYGFNIYWVINEFKVRHPYREDGRKSNYEIGVCYNYLFPRKAIYVDTYIISNTN